MKLYGNPPQDLGLVDLNPTEMMNWLYCPIKVPGMDSIVYPDNLSQFRSLWAQVRKNHIENWNPEKTAYWHDSYVYITAKTLYITPENSGNRPGWHSDGFMTDDLNYIWSDSNPTLFWEPKELVEFTQNHSKSLIEMDMICGNHWQYKTYPDKHLLELDETVIHRVNDISIPGVRTFVKISVSKNEYNLIGNSINHKLNLGWKYVDRLPERNSPSAKE